MTSVFVFNRFFGHRLFNSFEISAEVHKMAFHLTLSMLAITMLGQVQLEMRRINKNPEIKGSLLICSSAIQLCKLPTTPDFNPDQAMFLSNIETRDLTLVVPEREAARIISESIARMETPTQGRHYIGGLFFTNVLPAYLDEPDSMYTYLWKNDTVRKMAMVLLCIHRTSYGELRLQGWGVNDKTPVIDLPIRESANPKTDARTFEIEIVDNELEIKLLGKFVSYLPLRSKTYQF